MSSTIEVYLSAVRDVHIVRCSSFAASVIVFYDHFITFDQEIEYIWTAPWSSIGKSLFLINRYYTLLAVILNNYVISTPHLSNTLCLHWFKFQGVTAVFTVALTELILQLRLHALWSLNKRILVIMLAIYMACLVTSATLISQGMAHVSVSSTKILGLPFCTRTEPGTGFNQFWLPVLFSESVFCGLAVCRGIKMYYERAALFNNRQPLLEILIRDSILYFLIVFATYLTNAIFFFKGDDTQKECVASFAVAAASVMGNRLCLNVREMVQPKDGTTFASKVTSPVFRHEMTTFASDEAMPEYRGTTDQPDVEVHVDVHAEGVSDPNPI